MERSEILRRRREFKLEGYCTLAEVCFDGDWVSPLQIVANSRNGPCLVALHWLDAPTVCRERRNLQHGYLPGMLFNEVIDKALSFAKLHRSDVYLTQAFHLLPQTRSQRVPQKLVNRSFCEITRHEVEGRRVIALGRAAASACIASNVDALAVCHPSARGRTIEEKAQELARALLRANA